ncbi:Alkyl hydroperoxide reductase/ Thiol specific antioxidant/ Mal allergen [Wenzhouxiangella marina]|uniref:thioredoxin-dependent peroxiredoxin n=2 Tax=Wenzhouxiangella marina TaxID=1579979 RepID=A0A0K0XWT0_9GAMM|nr:Alkyl hydroperoxide reductase/ Thiol specific antioxidant/ Mal allergen [Wenzhouxiangella marina]
MTAQLNEKAPDFSLLDADGNVFRLQEMSGQRLLLVFYPGDDTPVCTRQLCDYRDGIEVFAELGVTVVGISPDDAESHQRFRARHDLPFVLLSDSDLSVAERYGCKALIGMKRGVFLLDEAQIIRYRHVEAVALFRRRREELVEAIRALG